jgi:hypothetical protein
MAWAALSVAAVVNALSSHNSRSLSTSVSWILTRGLAGSFLIFATVAIYQRRRIGKYLGSLPLVSFTALLLVKVWPGPATGLAESMGYWMVQSGFAVVMLYWAYAAAWSEKARLYYQG